MKTCMEIKELILKKVNIKMIETKPKSSELPAAVNLCEEVKEISVAKEVV